MNLLAKPLWRVVAGSSLLILFLVLEGCYYLQAVRGQADLMHRRRPVADVIADDGEPEALRGKLKLVEAARDFAVAELKLPDNQSYRSYADLEREFVVWNVFAAPEFSLQPKTWCFPVAGCVAYRGYFKEEAARKYAAKLESQGYDVAVGGVPAYSTLGRFADPVLNTMLRWSDVDLVATIFHELAHQKLYIKGDSTFNESFASAVAVIGMRRWLAKTGQPGRFEAYSGRNALRDSLMELVRTARDTLRELYASDQDTLSKRRQKRAILDALSASAQARIDANGGGSSWLAPPLNNARLASLALYDGRLDAFLAIFAECDEDLDCFYARAESLANSDEAERNRVLDALSD